MRHTISSIGKLANGNGNSALLATKRNPGRVSKKGSKSPRKSLDVNDLINNTMQGMTHDRDVILEQVGEEDGSMYEKSKISAEMSAKEAGMEAPSLNASISLVTSS